jgi:phosphate transport system substrate-binding protein
MRPRSLLAALLLATAAASSTASAQPVPAAAAPAGPGAFPPPVPVDPALPAYVPAVTVAGTLTGVCGMDTLSAIMRGWNEAFRRYHPGAEIRLETKDPLGPEERIALGPRTAELFHPTYQEYEDAYGYEPFRIRFAQGAYVLKSHVSAIGVYVSQANPLTGLSLAQLDAIYSEERRRGYPEPITTWGQLGLTGEWASQPIHVYGFYWRDDVTAYFRRLVMHDAPFIAGYQIPGGAMTRNTPTVAKGIMAAMAADPYGISFGNASYKTAAVKALALSDDRGVVGQFTVNDLASGRYPLERSLYLYVNRPPGQPLDPLVKEFLTFVLSREGQQMIERDHYLPLTSEMAAAERVKLN